MQKNLFCFTNLNVYDNPIMLFKIFVVSIITFLKFFMFLLHLISWYGNPVETHS